MEATLPSSSGNTERLSVLRVVLRGLCFTPSSWDEVTTCVFVFDLRMEGKLDWLAEEKRSRVLEALRKEWRRSKDVRKDCRSIGVLGRTEDCGRSRGVHKGLKMEQRCSGRIRRIGYRARELKDYKGL